MIQRLLLERITTFGKIIRTGSRGGIVQDASENWKRCLRKRKGRRIPQTILTFEEEWHWTKKGVGKSAGRSNLSEKCLI